MVDQATSGRLNQTGQFPTSLVGKLESEYYNSCFVCYFCLAVLCILFCSISFSENLTDLLLRHIDTDHNHMAWASRIASENI